MIETLYVRTLLAGAVAVGTGVAVTKALDMISTGTSETAMLGGVTFLTAIFLGGWLLAKIILGNGRTSGTGRGSKSDEDVGGSSTNNRSGNSSG